MKERLREDWTPPSIVPKVEEKATPENGEALTSSILTDSGIQEWYAKSYYIV